MSIATIATNSSASKLNLVYGHPLGDGAMEEIVLTWWERAMAGKHDL